MTVVTVVVDIRVVEMDLRRRENMEIRGVAMDLHRRGNMESRVGHLMGVVEMDLRRRGNMESRGARYWDRVKALGNLESYRDQEDMDLLWPFGDRAWRRAADSPGALLRVVSLMRVVAPPEDTRGVRDG